MPPAALTRRNRVYAAASLRAIDRKFDIRLAALVPDVDVPFDPPTRFNGGTERLNDSRIFLRRRLRPSVHISRFDRPEDDQHDCRDGDPCEDDQTEATNDAPFPTTAFLRRRNNPR